jgi:hypothetical protein
MRLRNPEAKSESVPVIVFFTLELLPGPKVSDSQNVDFSSQS